MKRTAVDLSRLVGDQPFGYGPAMQLRAGEKDQAGNGQPERPGQSRQQPHGVQQIALGLPRGVDDDVINRRQQFAATGRDTVGGAQDRFVGVLAPVYLPHLRTAGLDAHFHENEPRFHKQVEPPIVDGGRAALAIKRQADSRRVSGREFLEPGKGLGEKRVVEKLDSLQKRETADHVLKLGQDMPRTALPVIRRRVVTEHRLYRRDAAIGAMVRAAPVGHGPVGAKQPAAPAGNQGEKPLHGPDVQSEDRAVPLYDKVVLAGKVEGRQGIKIPHEPGPPPGTGAGTDARYRSLFPRMFRQMPEEPFKRLLPISHADVIRVLKRLVWPDRGVDAAPDHGQPVRAHPPGKLHGSVEIGSHEGHARQIGPGAQLRRRVQHGVRIDIGVTAIRKQPPDPPRQEHQSRAVSRGAKPRGERTDAESAQIRGSGSEEGDAGH